MADQATWTFDPTQESVLIGGRELTGFPATGSRVSIVYDTERFIAVGGPAPGYKGNSDRRATVTITLSEGSRDNAYLTALMAAQDGKVINGLLIRRKVTGAEIYVSDSCVIAKVADTTWTDGEQTITWTFKVARLNGGPLGLPAAPVITAEDL